MMAIQDPGLWQGGLNLCPSLPSLPVTPWLSCRFVVPWEGSSFILDTNLVVCAGHVLGTDVQQGHIGQELENIKDPEL